MPHHSPAYFARRLTPHLITVCCLLPLLVVAKPVRFDIPAQPAASALLVFSKQCGIDVLYSFADLQPVRSQAVAGEFEPDAALAALLRDTGFAASRDPAGKFVVTASRTPGRGGSVTARENGTLAGRVQNLATGGYLKSARVSIRGTALTVFTDETGTYRLASVPSGTVELEAFFTGLASQRATLNVVAGQAGKCDFQLGQANDVVHLEKVTVRAGDVVHLEKVTVRSGREADLAMNEQRFSPNLKLVAAPSTGEFWFEGNIGEFMKTLPGISAEYWPGDEVMGLGVRGFDPDALGVTVDGAPFASASSDIIRRGFQMTALSMNSISRVEITHVPTPSTPADSLGGSINLVSKSAFERNTAQLRYSLFLSANQAGMNLNRSPDNSDREIHKILPGFTFDYTWPVNPTFGIVLSLDRSQVFNEGHDLDKEYATSGPGTGAAIGNPYLQVARTTNTSRIRTRNGGSLKADWRVTPNTLLSFSVQGMAYDNPWASLMWRPETGASGSPTTASGLAMSFGPEFTHGATGRGRVFLTDISQNRKHSTMGENVRWRFDDGTWRVEGGLAGSRATTRILAPSEGYFSGVRLYMTPLTPGNPSRTTAVRVNLDGITASGPTDVQIFDNNNQPVDPSNFQNYRLDSAWVTETKTESTVRSADASVRRQVNTFSFPVALQMGGLSSVRTNDGRWRFDNYNFNGASGNAVNAPESVAPYVSTMANRPLGAGASGIVNNLPWISTGKLYAAWLKNPSLFTQTSSQRVAGEQGQIASSIWIREAVTAAYLQSEARLLQNRLNLVTGVRWEQTAAVGLGPLIDPGAAFLRDARGAFVHDALGRQIRRPEAGAGGSLEELRLTNQERGARGSHTYDGYFPSLNATYHVAENFQIRFGWAKTYGRPDFYNIAPSATINQANLTDAQFLDPSRLRGTISVNNPALKPWSAENYDLSFEYYSDQGGLATLGVFQKNIRDFFGDVLRPATAGDLVTFGLDSSYLGWNLATQTNTGRARIGGVTLNLNQSLRALGPIGRHFSVFGNLTELQLHGDRDADFYRFIKSSANWGFKCSGRNLEFIARWNYRGSGLPGRSDGVAYEADFYEYSAPATLVDVNLAYHVRKQMEFFVSAKNLFNRPQVWLRYGSQTPAYARQSTTIRYGTQFTAGIKGAF